MISNTSTSTASAKTGEPAIQNLQQIIEDHNNKKSVKPVKNGRYRLGHLPAIDDNGNLFCGRCDELAPPELCGDQMAYSTMTCNELSGSPDFEDQDTGEGGDIDDPTN